jgi:hypothetical protein
MSIASMADLKVARQKAAPVAGATGTRAATPAPVGVSSSIVNQLVTYIPTETIMLYVAYLAALGALKAPLGKHLSDASFTSRWIGLGVFAIVSALLALGLTYGKARQSKQTFNWPIFEMVTASVAFVAWAAALPDTPLSNFSGYRVEIGAFIVLATTVTIAVVAWIFGKVPDYTTVVTGNGT